MMRMMLVRCTPGQTLISHAIPQHAPAVQGNGWVVIAAQIRNNTTSKQTVKVDLLRASLSLLTQAAGHSAEAQHRRAHKSKSVAPLEQNVQNVRVLVHKSHARTIRIAVHPKDAPTNLQHTSIQTQINIYPGCRGTSAMHSNKFARSSSKQEGRRLLY